MIYRRYGAHDVDVSAFILGGHEFLPNGRSRGFNEDAGRAVTPGEIFDGFGGEKRKGVLAAAYELGITVFDATIDSEKEALGRNLEEMPPPGEILIQTRPEGMCYGYDPFNAKMADYALLKAEAERARELLRRDRVDVYNLAFLRTALERDAGYVDRIGENVARLKADGLIRFASADTFSGGDLYLRQIESGHFDSIFINFSACDDAALEEVVPAARSRGVAVFAREAFGKGSFFKAADEMGIADRDAVARAALRWILTREGVTAVAVGADTGEQLRSNALALSPLELGDDDRALLEKLRAAPSFRETQRRKREAFLGGR